VPHGKIVCAPSVPDQYLPLRVRGLRIDGLALTIDVTTDRWLLDGVGRTGLTLGSPGDDLR
jgi:hypothetical protein